MKFGFVDRGRRLRRALLALTFLGGVLAVVEQAPAVVHADPPPSDAWQAVGPGTVAVLDDGSGGTPTMTYDIDYGGGGAPSTTWTFSTRSLGTGTFDVSYHWNGHHAWCAAAIHLEAFVKDSDGTEVYSTVLQNAAGDCSDSYPFPEGGFTVSGLVSLPIALNDTYGFRISGSNGDSSSFLRGTFAVDGAKPPATPYTDPATIADNTSWVNAATLAGTVTGTLAQPGEARWYKFPVTPSSEEQVDLTGLAQNYDLTVYGDIGAAFASLTSTKDLTKLSAQFAADAYLPSVYSPSVYSPSVYSPSVYSPSVYSPSVYSPSVYSPSVYSPSVYSPSVYSPSVYSPSVYSPSVYSPSVYSPDQAFIDAFSSAQTRSLLAVSANEGTAPESLRVNTWNNTGYFYVRVLGRNGASDATHPFTLSLTSLGGPCNGVTLDTFATAATLHGTPGSATTVIVTDSSRWSPDVVGALNAKLAQLRNGLSGAVIVDVGGSARVRALSQQADLNTACPYAKNLAAQAIRDIVNSYRDTAGTLRYVVLIGGDTAIPFFRYPDTAGLGPESDYVPPVDDRTPAQASLRNDDVFGQDAYGSLVDLPRQGGVLPIPDLAVGRLVETPSEIAGMIDAYLGLSNGTLPAPTSSLVTGYDFLQSAADAVNTSFTTGMAGQGTADALITDQGVPTTLTTQGGTPTRDRSWTATDFAAALTGKRHDLLFLAGHFSANSTLAADYSTTFVTQQLDAHPGLLRNSLVISAGCHSGYNLQDADAVVGLTNPLDWAEAFAKQQATFVGGTGYQYADTDFLAYSAKLYAQLSQQLLAGTAGTPVAIGEALVKAKQAYLAEAATLSGIDQKALIEATVYGLPMTGLDLPGRQQPPAPSASTVATHPVLTGPGGTLGLQTADFDVTPRLDVPTGLPSTKPAVDLNGDPTNVLLQWHTGPDGVQTGPALPALPKQIEGVTSSTGDVLRGVGFRSGTYTDTPGITPLTGSPGTEQNGIHSTFESSVFFPQRLVTVNYFDALGTSGTTGTTQLITTPVQYRSEPGTTTNTERVYQGIGLQLFYSSNIDSFTTSGGTTNRPALAAPPSISGVTSSAANGVVTVAAHVTGDPSAGIQQVWVTFTGEAGSLHGRWDSVDLVQDPNDSTLWTGTFPLGTTLPSDARFIVQAANGVGLVGLDNNYGDGYVPDVVVGTLPVGLPATALALTAPATATLGSTATVSAMLTDQAGAPIPGAAVDLSLGAGTSREVTGADGRVSASFLVQGAVGPTFATAVFAGDAARAPSSAQSAVTVAKVPTTLTLSSPVVTRSLAGVSVTLRRADTSAPIAQQTVRVDLTGANGVVSFVATTNGSGVATPGIGTLPDGAYLVSASFTETGTYLGAVSNAVTSQLDTTAPTITAAATTSPNANGWYASSVKVHFTCVDAWSGISAVCPADQVLTGSGTLSSTAMTVTDAAGNTSAPSNVVTVRIDTTGPSLSPVVNPSPVLLHGAATATAGASDTGSGIASQSCAAVSTASVGTKSVTCIATDLAGNATTKSVTYRVIYRFDGFLQPINDTGHSICARCDLSIFKRGSTVPVKFQLKDANGVVVKAASAPLWLEPTRASTTGLNVCEANDNDPPEVDGVFRWDGTQYIYNWGTRSVENGRLWQLSAALDDGQVYTVVVGLR